MFDSARRWLLGVLGIGVAQALSGPLWGQVTVRGAAAYGPGEAEALRERMMAALGYERITVPGEQALAEWERLKATGRGWPVVIGNDEDLERIAEQFSIDDPDVFGPDVFGGIAGVPAPLAPSAILARAETISFPAERQATHDADGLNELAAALGEWPEQTTEDTLGLTTATDILTGLPFERVHIVLVPAAASWEVPAYLRWGGWNACPPPENHVAALRHWHEQYGLELVGINGDSMSLRATRSPTDRTEALRLAREQYLYCPDIVDQGTTTIANLAAALMGARWWFFWWD